MKKNDSMSDETKVVHAGIDDREYASVVPPIYQTSTFRFRDADHGANLFAGREEGYIYTRMGNPTIKALEDAVASLERGYKSLACASGMAAINTVLTGFLEKGDHVICSDAVYGPTNTLLKTVFTRFGVDVSFVDTTNLDAIDEAFTLKTRVVYVETPGNPTLCISDISEVSDLAHLRGAQLIVDNTFMSPVLQKPLIIGADVVVHSLTKFLNGHADVVGGIIVTKNDDDYQRLRKLLNQLGGVIDPFNAFLVHRGIKTLAIRMKKHSENALKIAAYLEKHPRVKWVRYPGLESHPQYKIARKQMSGFGGMISFELKDGYEAGKTLMNNVHLCLLAVSLGGVETLIEHPASMTHASMGKEQREKAYITDGLVRLSVGIENPDEIIADLDQALSLL